MTEKEIVQALRQCAQSDCSSCGMCPIFPDRECVEHLVAAAASLIERLTAENAALREKQRWIPVTERLPQVDGNYIVCTAHGSVTKVRFDPALGRFQRIFTHWMPLPPVPKEDAK